jgi:hypothetical protein
MTLDPSLIMLLLQILFVLLETTLGLFQLAFTVVNYVFSYKHTVDIFLGFDAKTLAADPLLR